MRVLIVVWPLTAHLYPTLPVAWALRGAGHEVRVASHHGFADTVTATGFDAVPLGTLSTTPPPWAVADHLLPEEHRERLTAALSVPPDDDLWATFSTYTLAASRIFHPHHGEPGERWTAVDSLVEAARDWRPDLVLWDPNWPSAAVAARACGAAHGRLLWGPDFIGWGKRLLDRHQGTLTAAGLPDPVADVVRPSAERHGVETERDLLLGQFTLDPTLPDMQLATDVEPVLVRRIPYAGAASVPEWLTAPAERPRVAVSLGTTQRTFQNDRSLTATLLDVVDGLDVEVAATLDAAQLNGRRPPDNVRCLDYLPLGLLLPSCSLLVHHGGIGTLTTAVANAVPHLVLSEAEAVAYASNARYLAGRGAGLAIDPARSAEAVREGLLRVLREPSFQANADELYGEWLAMPSPNDVVPTLEKLTAEHR